MPEELQDYWRCFHCNFATTDKAEAEAHFGDRDDAEEFKPICKWWNGMDDEDKAHALQSALQDLNYERMENYNLDKQIGAQREKTLDEVLTVMENGEFRTALCMKCGETGPLSWRNLCALIDAIRDAKGKPYFQTRKRAKG